jgi:hypothetical protein
VSGQTKSIYARVSSGTATVAVNGFNSFAKYQVTLTDEWQRFDAPSDADETGGNLFYAVDFRYGTATEVHIWGAQLETGSTATEYQKATSTYDVTEAGQADNYHLVFDGVDDSMVTPTVDFTGTDEMSVFAGVRKLSDGTTGSIVELSTSIDTNNGAFGMLAPTGFADNSTAWRSRGTATINIAVANSFSSPVTGVISGISDISQPITTQRINGVQVGQSTASQGTGNYGNYPLYIGSRAGTSVRFNGHLYSLLVRGALTADNLLNQTETYVASKTAGVDLT